MNTPADLAAWRARQKARRCWRCGVPFAWTTLADLEFCTDLAHRADALVPLALTGTDG